MKTPAGTTNRLVLLGTALVAILAVVALAQPKGSMKKAYDPKKNGVRLLFGGGKAEGRNKTIVNKDKLRAALDTLVDDSAYRVKYYMDEQTAAANWKEGNLPDPEISDITALKEYGGMQETPASGAGSTASTKAVGNATQCVTFQSIQELNAFVTAIQ